MAPGERLIRMSAMGVRFQLPVSRVTTPKATVDAVRDRLGGRAESLAGVGSLVLVPGLEGDTRPGVVLFATEDKFDVWIGDGRVRRAFRADVQSFQDEVPPDLMTVSSDALVFAQLREGDPVRFNTFGDRHDEGTIVEKCRFGALLKRADGSVVGVGFQKLWPIADGQVN